MKDSGDATRLSRAPLQNCSRLSRCARLAVAVAACLVAALSGLSQARAAVVVDPTTDSAALQAALKGTGLTINLVTIRNGVAGQFGTYTGFTTGPITIGNGVVLSSGDVEFVGPPPDPEIEFPEPSYWMDSGGTLEFDSYAPGRIENFEESSDVAALEVRFHLDAPGQIKFDFIFGSVEFPFWTSEYTDAFIVFLDGTDATNQITLDDSGRPIQVGISFAGDVETGDQNTAFGDPHGVLRPLTTTSPVLPAGEHTLIFEVGDVNDGFLDSAVFIANLRAEPGPVGTAPTVPLLKASEVQRLGGSNVVSLTWLDLGVPVQLQGANAVTGIWNDVSSSIMSDGQWATTTATNAASLQFYRLRAD